MTQISSLSFTDQQKSQVLSKLCCSLPRFADEVSNPNWSGQEFVFLVRNRNRDSRSRVKTSRFWQVCHLTCQESRKYPLDVRTEQIIQGVQGSSISIQTFFSCVVLSPTGTAIPPLHNNTQEPFTEGTMQELCLVKKGSAMTENTTHVQTSHCSTTVMNNHSFNTVSKQIFIYSLLPVWILKRSSCQAQETTT